MRRTTGFLLAVAAACAPGLAPGAEDFAAAVRACRAESDDARRLACYDRVAGRDSAAQAQAPTAVPAAAATAASTASLPTPAGPAPAAAAKPADDFGRERQIAYEEDKKREEATRAVGELRASIVAIETRMDGLMTFTLDNGQVWRQNRPDSRFSIKQGDAVLIQPGSLNSFILSGPNKKSTRVTRVK
jgi:hypothetical protein